MGTRKMDKKQKKRCSKTEVGSIFGVYQKVIHRIIDIIQKNSKSILTSGTESCIIMVPLKNTKKEGVRGCGSKMKKYGKLDLL